jgi:hydroxyacylglutathione hydrolase
MSRACIPGIAKCLVRSARTVEATGLSPWMKAEKRTGLQPRLLIPALLACLALALLCPSAKAQLVAGALGVQWNQGSPDCAKNPQPPLQVHAYNAQTFILRESLCSTFEAPFVYLLLGSQKAMLIDTGDVADPLRMPLATTVLGLLPGDGSAKLPLLVVHTHRHLDHRAGDPQFAHLPNVQVVGYDLLSVQRFYGFTHWPDGQAQVDLGGRIVDVLPTPGHHATEVSFYDRMTGLFFSGDFLLPARLLIDDARADEASAQRVAAFVRNRHVSFVLGGHIEMNAQGRLFPWESTWHPGEHVLQLSKNDLLALPAALSRFNGFYTASGGFIMMNSMRILAVFGFAVLLALTALIALLIAWIRRRRSRSYTLPATR